MKKSIFMLALASLALVGCSKDEVIEVQQDAIRFTANAANATRGTATTTSSLNAANQEFKVWAYYDEGTTETAFMSDISFSYQNDGTWTANPTKFWPNDYELDFYAVHPVPAEGNGIEMSMTAGGDKQITEFSANTVVANQIDLIYATEMDANKQSTAQAINFRHALSQIVFAAKVPHRDLSVDIKSVTVHNVVNKGTFTFPTVSTSTQLVNDTGAETETSTVEGIQGTYGTWALSTDADDVTSFAAGIKVTEGIIGATQVSLMADNGALFLLPQAFKGGDYSKNEVNGGDKNNKPGYNGEIYFVIECKIRQNNNYLFGTADAYGAVAIPASSAYDAGSALAGDKWEQGKKYIYIFSFENGGGYDPTTGDPILVPIKLTVTVDEFQSANKDVNM